MGQLSGRINEYETYLQNEIKDVRKAARTTELPMAVWEFGALAEVGLQCIHVRGIVANCAKDLRHVNSHLPK